MGSSSKRIKILLVEDMEINRVMLAKLLCLYIKLFTNGYCFLILLILKEYYLTIQENERFIIPLLYTNAYFIKYCGLHADGGEKADEDAWVGDGGGQEWIGSSGLLQRREDL